MPFGKMSKAYAQNDHFATNRMCSFKNYPQSGLARLDVRGFYTDQDIPYITF